MAQTGSAVNKDSHKDVEVYWCSGQKDIQMKPTSRTAKYIMASGIFVGVLALIPIIKVVAAFGSPVSDNIKDVHETHQVLKVGILIAFGTITYGCGYIIRFFESKDE